MYNRSTNIEGGQDPNTDPFLYQRPKSIDQVPKLACALNGRAAHSHDIYAASHGFIIKFLHSDIDQLYIRVVSYHNI